MPNMNAYIYMQNYKVLNNKPIETRYNNCTAIIKILVFCQIIVK